MEGIPVSLRGIVSATDDPDRPNLRLVMSKNAPSGTESLTHDARIQIAGPPKEQLPGNIFHGIDGEVDFAGTTRRCALDPGAPAPTERDPGAWHPFKILCDVRWRKSGSPAGTWDMEQTLVFERFHEMDRRDIFIDDLRLVIQVADRFNRSLSVSAHKLWNARIGQHLQLDQAVPSHAHLGEPYGLTGLVTWNVEGATLVYGCGLE